MQTVKLTPMRMIFNNPESNFSIISCRTKDETIEVNPKYGTISLKGTGIADLKMGQSIDCIIEPCVDGSRFGGMQDGGWGPGFGATGLMEIIIEQWDELLVEEDGR